jgi:hypothetical protein
MLCTSSRGQNNKGETRRELLRLKMLVFSGLVGLDFLMRQDFHIPYSVFELSQFSKAITDAILMENNINVCIVFPYLA